jgi:geranylgeranyl transferase type-2 subunit beta
MSSYLQALMVRLSEGLAHSPDEFRARHVAYLTQAQNTDGGFSGREGDSDLYYTGFALRGLAILDALTPDIAERAAEFLRHSLTQPASVVDFYSLLYSCVLIQLAGGPDVLADSPADWPERVADTLEGFRKPDGGYGKTTDAASGSTYHTFLVCLCYELLGRDVPDAGRVMSFIDSRKRDDGGFVEIAPMRRSGTNPTAAAVGVLEILQGEKFVPSDLESTVAFLAEMPSLEGGLRANSRIPLADLLSTFTGVWTLYQLGALGRIDSGATLGFAEALESPEGGFRAGLWDEEVDVEYTFYGLGVIGLLSGS